ncbi:MAG: dTMP kinase [Candidatus Aenigmarchaeota archaeon]|nr:dTMP kinase [Candidatus Aenigmarchaeota archaeon]
MEQGKFIVFEGLDKSGKETQAKMVVDFLKSKGFQAVFTEEPNPHNMVGRLIRDWLNKKFEISSGKAVTLLYTADRYEHLKTFVIPQLEQGISVVSDRYYYSTIAYQSILYGVDSGWIREVNRFARKPDLTIFLDVPAEESLKRTHDNDRHENMNFQQKVMKAYGEITEREGFFVVNGNRTREEVFADVRKRIEELFGLRS